ncbi:MAG: putative sulfate exporter family transporter [Candidatus Aminicenantes bacterium]|nr:putative sulfate exporter family transporter [Candidatus Aminicenantes bacterium]
MKKEQIPGWLLMIAVGAVSMVLSNQVTAGGKHPLEATALAVVIGILARNLGLVPTIFHAGIKAFEKFLIWGVILIGATLNFKDFQTQGPKMLSIILVTMLVSYFVIYALGRLFKLPWSLSTLLSVGTTICGGSAIAITAPLIKAKEEETSYAIGTITLWGLVAILLYPKLAQLLGVSDIRFGVFAGTAIHATPQVVGAGFIFSDLAGKTATAIKLVRNCFMAPLAFILAAWYAKTSLDSAKRDKQSINLAKAFPWFLFGYFLMAGLNTAGYFTKAGLDALTWLGRFLITISMAGIGLNTVFGAFKKVGFKPLIVGLLGALVVAAVSIAMIALVL